MSNTIAITGLGILSALGVGVASNKDKLLKSESGLGQLKSIHSIHSENAIVGEVPVSNAALSKLLHLPNDHNFTRTALLGSLAAKEALTQSRIQDVNEVKTGFISATTVGGMDKTEQYFKDFGHNTSAQKYIASHHAGDSTQKIAELLGITHFTTTISTACSSAANAILLGGRMIRAGMLDRVIVGGTDALSKFTLNGFHSLLLLSDSHCKPFDANRNGLNLGEAAAYLVLESVKAAQGKPVLAYLSGYGNANDAFHQTASSEEGTGAYLAMKAALQSAELLPSEIQYVNAHGTATPNNDLSESRALQRVFGSQMPAISSTKPFTGHTLAAAGAVEAVFSVLALETQAVFANLNFEMPIPEIGIIPETHLQEQPIQHVLSNSFGFGGNCSSLVFSSS
ncbi:MAG: beta-ketoacyl-[acyl-carrier-protein] synthase family protein [Marinirhabdus sp.]|nr:beta-ketoacyl-[acyl-carrier-protein] synthase family protein [Marinirhabdus sp.]